MDARRQDNARSVLGQSLPPARESGTDVFDALLDPWQLACILLVIAVVFAAGWWAGASGSREVESSGSEADGETGVADGAK
jgi:hypothetical protein